MEALDQPTAKVWDRVGIKLEIPGSVTDCATEQQIKCLTRTQHSASVDEYTLKLQGLKQAWDCEKWF